MNFPGIDRSISEKTIAEGKRFISRFYRNRRLGEFLKELDLSEGHSSGIPTIQEELEKNGSPRAEFFTDEDRRAMRIRIPIHPAFLEETDDETVNLLQNETSFETSLKQVLKQKDFDRLISVIRRLEKQKKITIQEVMEEIQKSRTTAWRYMQILVDLGVVETEGKTNNIVYRLH
ncbi:MAG: HTH domain-containing protein [Clostridium sp.]|nr:HTH domain-containing protein [Clostridium sp.]